MPSVLTQTAVNLEWNDPVRPAKTIVTSSRSAGVASKVTMNIYIHSLFIGQVYVSFKHVIWKRWTGEICEVKHV